MWAKPNLNPTLKFAMVGLKVKLTSLPPTAELYLSLANKTKTDTLLAE